MSRRACKAITLDDQPDAIGSMPVQCPNCGDQWRAVQHIGDRMRCLGCGVLFDCPGGPPGSPSIDPVCCVCTPHDEIDAIRVVMIALEELPDDSRRRVLAYVCDWDEHLAARRASAGKGVK